MPFVGQYPRLLVEIECELENFNLIIESGFLSLLLDIFFTRPFEDDLECIISITQEDNCLHSAVKVMLTGTI